MLCIGLFGTCGKSTWRDLFKKRYSELGIAFFDPNKTDWKPEDAEEEARHLADDDVILFPITSESYGIGSLSETGFTVLQATKLNDRQDLVIMIQPDLDPSLDDLTVREESLRTRALVKQHLRKLRLGNLYMVDTLDEMLSISQQLYEAAKVRSPLTKYNPHTGS